MAQEPIFRPEEQTNVSLLSNGVAKVIRLRPRILLNYMAKNRVSPDRQMRRMILCQILEIGHGFLHLMSNCD